MNRCSATTLLPPATIRLRRAVRFGSCVVTITRSAVVSVACSNAKRTAGSTFVIESSAMAACTGHQSTIASARTRVMRTPRLRDRTGSKTVESILRSSFGIPLVQQSEGQHAHTCKSQKNSRRVCTCLDGCRLGTTKRVRHERQNRNWTNRLDRSWPTLRAYRHIRT
jgi:hypothetical protein